MRFCAAFLLTMLAHLWPGATSVSACMYESEIDSHHVDAAETVFRGRIVSYQRHDPTSAMLRFKVIETYKGRGTNGSRVIWQFSSVETPRDIAAFRKTYGDEHLVGLGFEYRYIWGPYPAMNRFYHLYEKYVRGARWLLTTHCAPPLIVKLDSEGSGASGIEPTLRQLGLTD